MPTLYFFIAVQTEFVILLQYPEVVRGPRGNRRRALPDLAQLTHLTQLTLWAAPLAPGLACGSHATAFPCACQNKFTSPHEAEMGKEDSRNGINSSTLSAAVSSPTAEQCSPGPFSR